MNKATAQPKTSQNSNQYESEHGLRIGAIEYPIFQYTEFIEKDEEFAGVVVGTIDQQATTLNPQVAHDSSEQKTWRVQTAVIRFGDEEVQLFGHPNGKALKEAGLRYETGIVFVQNPSVLKQIQNELKTGSVTVGNHNIPIDAGHAIEEYDLPKPRVHLRAAPLSQAEDIQGQIEAVNAVLPPNYKPIKSEVTSVRVYSKDNDPGGGTSLTSGVWEYRDAQNRPYVRVTKRSGKPHFKNAVVFRDIDTGEAFKGRSVNLRQYVYKNDRGQEFKSFLPKEWYDENGSNSAIAKAINGTVLEREEETKIDPHELLNSQYDVEERNAILQEAGLAKAVEVAPHSLAAGEILNESGSYGGKISNDNVLAYAVSKLYSPNSFQREVVKDGKRRLFVPKEQQIPQFQLDGDVRNQILSGKVTDVSQTSLPRDVKDFITFKALSDRIHEIVFGTAGTSTGDEAIDRLVQNTTLPSSAVLTTIAEAKKKVDEAQNAIKAAKVTGKNAAAAIELHDEYIDDYKLLIDELRKHSPSTLRDVILNMPYVSQTADNTQEEDGYVIGNRKGAHKRVPAEDEPRHLFKFNPAHKSSVYVNWKSRYPTVPDNDAKLDQLATKLRSRVRSEFSDYAYVLNKSGIFDKVEKTAPNGSTYTTFVSNGTNDDLANKMLKHIREHNYPHLAVSHEEVMGYKNEANDLLSSRLNVISEKFQRTKEDARELVAAFRNSQMFFKEFDADLGLSIYTPLTEEAEDVYQQVSNFPINEKLVQALSDQSGLDEDEIRVALWVQRHAFKGKSEDEMEDLELRKKTPIEAILRGKLPREERLQLKRFEARLENELQDLYNKHGFVLNNAVPIYFLKGKTAGQRAPGHIEATAKPGELIPVNLKEVREHGGDPALAAYGVTAQQNAKQGYSYYHNGKRIAVRSKLPAVGGEQYVIDLTSKTEEELNKLGYTKFGSNEKKKEKELSDQYVQQGMGANEAANLAHTIMEDAIKTDEDRVMDKIKSWGGSTNVSFDQYEQARREVLREKMEQNSEQYNALKQDIKKLTNSPDYRENMGRLIAMYSHSGVRKARRGDMTDINSVMEQADEALNASFAPMSLLEMPATLIMPKFKGRGQIDTSKVPEAAKAPLSNGQLLYETLTADQYLNDYLFKDVEPDQKQDLVKEYLKSHAVNLKVEPVTDLLLNWSGAVKKYDEKLDPETHEIVRTLAPEFKAHQMLMNLAVDSAYKSKDADALIPIEKRRELAAQMLGFPNYSSLSANFRRMVDSYVRHEVALAPMSISNDLQRNTNRAVNQARTTLLQRYKDRNVSMDDDGRSSDDLSIADRTKDPRSQEHFDSVEEDLIPFGNYEEDLMLPSLAEQDLVNHRKHLVDSNNAVSNDPRNELEIWKDFMPDYRAKSRMDEASVLKRIMDETIHQSKQKLMDIGVTIGSQDAMENQVRSEMDEISANGTRLVQQLRAHPEDRDNLGSLITKNNGRISVLRKAWDLLYILRRSADDTNPNSAKNMISDMFKIASHYSAIIDKKHAIDREIAGYETEIAAAKRHNYPYDDLASRLQKFQNMSKELIQELGDASRQYEDIAEKVRRIASEMLHLHPGDLVTVRGKDKTPYYMTPALRNVKSSEVSDLVDKIQPLLNTHRLATTPTFGGVSIDNAKLLDLSRANPERKGHLIDMTRSMKTALEPNAYMNNSQVAEAIDSGDLWKVKPAQLGAYLAQGATIYAARMLSVEREFRPHGVMDRNTSEAHEQELQKMMKDYITRWVESHKEELKEAGRKIASFDGSPDAYTAYTMAWLESKFFVPGQLTRDSRIIGKIFDPSATDWSVYSPMSVAAYFAQKFYQDNKITITQHAAQPQSTKVSVYGPLEKKTFDDMRLALSQHPEIDNEGAQEILASMTILLGNMPSVKEDNATNLIKLGPSLLTNGAMIAETIKHKTEKDVTSLSAGRIKDLIANKVVSYVEQNSKTSITEDEIIALVQNFAKEYVAHLDEPEKARIVRNAVGEVKHSLPILGTNVEETKALSVGRRKLANAVRFIERYIRAQSEYKLMEYYSMNRAELAQSIEDLEMNLTDDDIRAIAEIVYQDLHNQPEANLGVTKVRTGDNKSVSTNNLLTTGYSRVHSKGRTPYDQTIDLISQPVKARRDVLQQAKANNQPATSDQVLQRQLELAGHNLQTKQIGENTKTMGTTIPILPSAQPSPEEIDNEKKAALIQVLRVADVRQQYSAVDKIWNAIFNA